MKRWTRLLFSTFGMLCMFACISNTQAKPLKPIAVLELFTSEGCSSCPPADTIARRLAQRARTQNLNIFTLVYHVDYWNYLGWKDRFSQKRFTYRQNLYARRFRSRSIYTPQLVVNGVRHNVGSRPRAVKMMLQQGLKEKPTWTLSLCKQQQSKTKVRVRYKLGGHRSRWHKLHVALVEWGLFSKVVRGENAGRTLQNANVVREFRSYGIAKQKRGSSTLSLRRVKRKKKSAIIAFVQDIRTMRILGATRMLLGSAKSCKSTG